MLQPAQTTKLEPKALAGSLKRLRTDYIDLYQVHWPNPYYEYNKDHPETPLEETMEVLLTQQEKGDIRYTVLYPYCEHRYGFVSSYPRARNSLEKTPVRELPTVQRHNARLG